MGSSTTWIGNCQSPQRFPAAGLGVWGQLVGRENGKRVSWGSNATKTSTGKMDRPVIEHDPDALRLRIGLPHWLVKVHQLLDAHFGPGLEQDASAERVEGAHDAGGRIARQTALGMRTGFSRFFLGTGQARLPRIGQFVQIEQDFLALVLLSSLLERADLIDLGLRVRIRTMHMVASALGVDAQALQELAHAALGFQVEPFTVLNQVF